MQNDKPDNKSHNNHGESRPPSGLRASDWLTETSPWKGFFNGEDAGAGITVLSFPQPNVGDGPSLHMHEYEEVFIIRKGNALFTVGHQKIEASAGDVVVGPANVPHKFHNVGPGPLETIDIHLSDRWVQVEVDDPEVG